MATTNRRLQWWPAWTLWASIGSACSGNAPPPSNGSGGGALVVAPDGAKGVDAFDPIASEQARTIRAQGYDFAVRYVRHADSTLPHLTNAEKDGILGAGLGLMLVQEGRGFEKTRPTSALGASDGQAAVAHASSVGYPKEGLVWLDVEAVVAPGATPSDVTAYAKAWYDAVAPHFDPGYYVGPAGILDAEGLGELPFERFWKSGTDVPTPTGRGYQLVQHPPRTVAGVSVDLDTTQADERGQRVRWLAKP